jgi:tape measure domain-containing protein
MPILSFKIAADLSTALNQISQYQQQIESLKRSLSQIDVNKSSAQAKAMSDKLSVLSAEMRGLQSNVSQSSVKFAGEFKTSIFAAEQKVNSLTEDIIKQKQIIRETQDDVARLGKEYSQMGRWDKNASGTLSQLNQARSALSEQKYALGELESEHATAKLSVKKLNDEYKVLGIEGGASLQSIAQKIRNLGAISIAGIGVKDFINKIITVRGEFENIEATMGVFLKGDKDKTAAIMNEVKQYSLTAPLTVKQMAGSIQQMMGFGLSSDDAMKYMKAMNNISMGNGDRFQRLVLAFSEMSAAGKLMGQNLRQMVFAGFNPLMEMSQKTGKSMGELREEMRKGAISSQMVQQAFIDATSAGGRFYGMASAGAKTVQGQMSMLQDAIDITLNNIGQSNEGIILGGINLTKELILNYQKVGDVLETLIATYGVYKAAVIAGMVIDKVEATIKTYEELRQTYSRVQAAQEAFNLSALKNPYAMLAAAIVGVVIVLYKLHAAYEAHNGVVATANREIDEIKSNYENLSSIVNEYLPIAQNATKSTEERTHAIQVLKSIMPSYFSKLDIETAKTYKLANALYALNNAGDIQIRIKNIEAQRDYQQKKSAYDKLVKDAAGGGGVMAPSLSSPNELGIYQAKKAMEDAQLTAQITKKAVDKVNTSIKENARKAQGKSIKPTANQEAKNILVDIAARKKREQEIKAGKYATGSAVGNLDNEEQGLSKDYKDYKTLTGKDISPRGEAKTEKSAESAARKRITAQQKAARAESAYQKALQTERYNQASRDAELEKEVTKSTINAMQEGTAKKVEQIQADYDDEIDTINQKQKEALKKKIDDERNVFNANPKNKGKVFNANNVTLSQSDKDKYDTLRDNAADKRGNALDTEKEQMDGAMDEYLQKYGTTQEKILAIKREYARKIEDATSDGAKLSLQKEMEAAIESVNFEDLKNKMDWDTLFGDLDKVSKKHIDAVIKQIEQFKSTKEFKNLSPTDRKSVIEGETKLQNASDQINPIPTFKKSFQDVVQAYKEYRNAPNVKKSADIRLNTAQQNYDKAKQQGNPAEIQAAKDLLDAAKANDDAAKTAVGNTDNLKEKLVAFGAAGSKVSDKIQNGANDVDSAYNNFKALGKVTSNGGIGGVLQGVVEGAGGLSKAFTSLKSLDIPGMVNGVSQMVLGTATTIANLGGIVHIFSSADYKSYDKLVSQYQKLTTVWDELISQKEKYIKEDYGTEIVKTEAEIQKYYQLLAESDVTLGKAYLNSGAGTGSHSIKRRDTKKISSEGWKQLQEYSESSGVDYSSLSSITGLFDLTADQLENLKETAPTFWAELDSTTQTYLNNIISAGDSLTDSLKEAKEQLLGTSFDSFLSNWESMLDDMNSDNESFSQNFSQQLMKSIISSEVVSKYKTQLQAVYDTWYASLNGGTITQASYKALQTEYLAISDQAKSEVDALQEAFGWTNTDNTSGSTNLTTVNATQDSVDEENGRLTAVQTAVTDQGTLLDMDLKTVQAAIVAGTQTAEAIHTIMANSYLEIQGIHTDTTSMDKTLKSVDANLSTVKDKIKNL